MCIRDRVGRPGAVESHPGQMLTEDGPRYGTWETGNILKVSQSSVEKHLQQLDYVNLFDVWLPRKSSWVLGSHLTEFPHAVFYRNGRETFHFQDKV